MPFIVYNANPVHKQVIDCTVRAISKVTGKDWDEVYIGLSVKGFEAKDMPNSNAVWGEYLHSLGYERRFIPNNCPNCYTVKDFCKDNPVGSFILATGNHVIAVIDGDYYDTWDSGDTVPLFYWLKKEMI